MTLEGRILGAVLLVCAVVLVAAGAWIMTGGGWLGGLLVIAGLCAAIVGGVEAGGVRL